MRTYPTLYAATALATVGLANATPVWTPSPAALRAAANTSTGNPANCTGGTKYFPQLVDHANLNGTTFLQQYQVMDQHYRPGGPIIFVQLWEGAKLQCLELLNTPNLAQQLGGITVALEHRYFGASCPEVQNCAGIVGWGLDVPMTLDFDVFQSVVLILAILVVGGFLRDGKSNYLEGSLCVLVYVLVAVAAYCYNPPNPEISSSAAR